MNWTSLCKVKLELDWAPEHEAPWYIFAVLLILLLLGLLGATLTQHQQERILLNRTQWQVLQAHRQTRQDVVRLNLDLAQLVRLSSEPRLDPVEAVWQAQRLYVRHKAGATATATARQALIEAGQIAVGVARGSDQSQNLKTALQQAQDLLGLLQTP